MAQASGVNAGSAPNAKRKLSTSAPDKEENKKSKVESKDNESAVTAVYPPTTSANGHAEPKEPTLKNSEAVDSESVGSGDDDDEDEEDDDDDDDEGTGNAGIVDASVRFPKGQRKFYIWAEGLDSIVPPDSCGDPAFLVPKPPLDEFYRKLSTCKVEEKDDIVEDICHDISKFCIRNDDKAKTTPDADKLVKIYEEESKKTKWWFEITLDTQKPESGSPAIEAIMEEYEEEGVKWKRGEQSRWWIVGVAAPDEKTTKGIDFMSEYVWDGSTPYDWQFC
ncbi:hypothetical protein NLI96_g2531 [Meripilus lineatus]|uniref:Uncharacterized protein n=1 Tax=Meripilus lineatus TaxID=2056292 RepID=A0AAD5YLS9_9APHY|nr:hypothetical protein NLI96_g2531 [Physisporinus lineatus]